MKMEIKCPMLPESVADATVAIWHVQPGEQVVKDQSLVDIESDKVVLEVVAPLEGTVTNILATVGETVLSEQVIATFEGLSEVNAPVQQAVQPTNNPAVESVSNGVNKSADESMGYDGINKIFIVHGHDGESKEKVARCVEKLGLEPIILHEQPGGGKTIIEKFEHYSKRSGFAIVLATPDDEGCKIGGDKQLRARQNVILELGYFIGLFGRHRVITLVRGDLEMPSDYLGVEYTPLDDNGSWKITLCKELKNAGVKFDESKILSL